MTDQNPRNCQDSYSRLSQIERVRRIELPSSAWKAEVLAVELHPQSVSMVAVRVCSEMQIRDNHDVYRSECGDTLRCLWIQK